MVHLFVNDKLSHNCQFRSLFCRSTTLQQAGKRIWNSGHLSVLINSASATSMWQPPRSMRTAARQRAVRLVDGSASLRKRLDAAHGSG